MLNYFLSSLQEYIQMKLYVLKPPSLHEAMGMAKLIDDKYKPMRVFLQQWFIPARILQQVPSKNTATPSNQASPHGAILIKWLTSAEMAARREQGLCFNCDPKFTQGHRCNPPQFLYLMSDEWGRPTSEINEQDPSAMVAKPEPTDDAVGDGDNPCISFHALNALTIPSTLKIAGKIHGKEAVALINGESTSSRPIGVTIWTY